MASNTEKQELASITTFYYGIEKGANLGTLAEPATGSSSRDEDPVAGSSKVPKLAPFSMP